MSEFNFKSAVCTSRVQSERLLALGLKKETADMHWFYTGKIHGWQCSVQCYQDAIAEPFRKEDATNGNIQPAWSLGYDFDYDEEIMAPWKNASEYTDEELMTLWNEYKVIHKYA